ncbi:MAG: hypothetical protein IJ494_08930, partial [Bacteroides sp.]|nr:hypothetical protein [Bacteroides sp.]
MLLATTSCQQDEFESSAQGNEVDVTFTLQQEGATGAATRAIGDGTTATDLYFAAYNGDGNYLPDLKPINQPANGHIQFVDKKATVQLRLVKGQTYNFVFWAQSPNTTAYTTSFGTNASDKLDNATVSVDYSGNANDENRDAFWKVEKEVFVNGPLTKEIVLKRPFAQVNVGINIGELAEAKAAGVNVTKSRFTFSEAATALKVASGKVTGKTEVVLGSYAIPESVKDDKEGDLKNVPNKDGKYEDYEYIAMSYILVNTDGVGEGYTMAGTEQLVINNATFTIYDNDKEIKTYQLPNLPLQRNYRTNIIGSIMSDTEFTIVINPIFDGDINYPDNQKNELLFAAANGGEVTLTEDVVLDGALNVTSDMVLNLNGYTITNKVENTSTDVIIVRKGATLTINGEEGGVTAVSGNNGYAIISQGKLIINGGTYRSGLDEKNDGNCTIYASGNGEIYIYGGDFSTPEGDDATYVINKKDGDRATTKIAIYGGQFKNFNPQNNKAEGAGTNFVAEGYKAVEKNGTYYVVADEVDTVATTAAELTEALTAGKEVWLANDITVQTSITGNVNIDGAGNTLSATKSDAQYMIQPTGGVIKNLTISGYNERNENGKVLRGIYLTPATDMVIENCNISGVAYPLNTGEGSVKGKTLTVKNSTLVGWTSFSGKLASASFENCKFGIGSYFQDTETPSWNGCLKPYVTTVLTDCTFDNGFYLDFSALTEGATVTLKNCKVGSTVITADNIKTLLNIEGTPAEGALVVE